MPEVIHNLDEDRSPPEYVVLKGVKMDTSFIPVGIAVPISRAYAKWVEHSIPITEKVLEGNPDVVDVKVIRRLVNKMLDGDPKMLDENHRLQVAIVAIFTRFHDKTMTEEWLLANTTVKQVVEILGRLITAIASTKEIAQETRDGILEAIESRKKNGET